MLINKIITGQLKENCYIITTNTNKCLIIDPGSDFDKINSYISKNKFLPLYIFLTHGHYDHIGAISKLKENYPNVKIAISKNDSEFLNDNTKNLSSSYSDYNQPLLTQDIIINDNDKFNIDDISITCILTPGHTPGGVCYLINNSFLLTGDTIFKNSIGRTDLYGGNQIDLKNSIKKIYKLLSTNNKNDIKIYPGHGFSSTLYQELQFNPYLGFLKKTK